MLWVVAVVLLCNKRASGWLLIGCGHTECLWYSGCTYWDVWKITSPVCADGLAPLWWRSWWLWFGSDLLLYCTASPSNSRFPLAVQRVLSPSAGAPRTDWDRNPDPELPRSPPPSTHTDRQINRRQTYIYTHTHTETDRQVPNNVYNSVYINAEWLSWVYSSKQSFSEVRETMRHALMNAGEKTSAG